MDTKIILKSVDEIIPYANNPRRNDRWEALTGGKAECIN